MTPAETTVEEALRLHAEYYNRWLRAWYDKIGIENYCIGDRVEKYTGDYQLAGEVRSVLTTKAGDVLYVVEHAHGFLRIYGPQNIRRLP